MEQGDYLKILRRYLADPDGRIWDDSMLRKFLDDAVKEYSIDSGAFIGSMAFFPDANGNYFYPDDFGSFLVGWNKESSLIKPTTADELFEKKYFSVPCAGDAKYIYDTHSTDGEFSLYPDPSVGQNVESWEFTSQYGEVFDSAYGVFLTEDYGTTLRVDSFEYAGNVFYKRIGKYNEIKDYMAVICYALSLAYNSDADFGDAEKAFSWRKQYETRVAVFSSVMLANVGKMKKTTFY
jgi:hypothetical protein